MDGFMEVFGLLGLIFHTSYGIKIEVFLPTAS
jgi:hypothetical protein